MPQRLSSAMPCLAIASVFAVLMLAGCGGGGVPAGAAGGWVFQPIGGGQPVVLASPTPPAGYEPVAGATISIEGHPDLTMTTGPDGGYMILDIPPGDQTLVVEAPGQPVQSYSIPIIANQITWGTGHEEGGGGIS